MFGFGAWRQQPHGPALSGAVATASCTVEGPPTPTGYGVLVRGVVDALEVGDVTGDVSDDLPLTYQRGSYGWVSGP